MQWIIKGPDGNPVVNQRGGQKIWVDIVVGILSTDKTAVASDVIAKADEAMQAFAHCFCDETLPP